MDWMLILTWLVGAGGVTFIVQMLRVFKVPQNIPASLRPLIGPAVGFLAGIASWATGVSVDFGPIQGVLLGTTSATLFDVGRGANKLKGTGTGNGDERRKHA